MKNNHGNLLKPEPEGAVKKTLLICLFGALLGSAHSQGRLTDRESLARGAPGSRRTFKHTETRLRRAEMEYDKRAFPMGEIPSGAMARALSQTRQGETNTATPKTPQG